MTETQQLAQRIMALAQRMGVESTTMSRKLFGGGARLSEIEAGSSITMKVYKRVSEQVAELEAATSAGSLTTTSTSEEAA